jgi:hypothetical protein
MALALLNMFDELIVERIQDFLPEDPPDPFEDFEYLLGTVQIYQTKHYVTHSGGPEGGLVYFYREREAGWYRWSRNWGTPPAYTKLETGVVLMVSYPDGSERIGIAPDNWEEVYDIGEDIFVLIGDNETMQDMDRQ